MTELCDILQRHCHSPITASAIPRLMLTRSDTITAPCPVVYNPLFCVIAQGRKRVFLGNEEFCYDPSNYLIASLDLPVVGEVIEAPYAGFALSLDPATLTALLLDMPPGTPNLPPSKAMAVTPLDEALFDPILRLLRLLDQPRDIPILAPLIEREILYRLLLGPRGEALRHLALPINQRPQISRAIDTLRRRYDESIRIEELAQHAGMSVPSFHRHFRAVTAMSPLQFQKRIRLLEARRLLVSKDADAATIGFEVGYESPSQFTREYRRLFGAPPVRDSQRMRETLVPQGSP